MGPSLVNSVHIPVSNVDPSLESVLSRARCVRWTLDTGDRAQCVREVCSHKSEVNRWTMVGYAAQLNSASFSQRVNRSPPPCIENCIMWHLKESVLHHWTRGGFGALYGQEQLHYGGAFNTLVP